MSAVLDDNTGFEEPATDAPPTREAERNALAISTDISRVQNQLSELDRVEAGLADLAARYPVDVVYDVTSTKGMKDAIEHRAAWRDPRILVEKARKMAKAPLLALGKNIDARAALLTARLTAGEQPMDQLIKAEEARKEEEKQAKINAEMGRVMAIQEALGGIGQDVMIACGKTSGDVQALLDTMRAGQPDPLVFQEMIDQARAAWSAGIAKLETTHKAKLWEEEQRRQEEAAKASAEAERVAETARLARVAEEQAAEAKRLKDAADAIAAQQKAEADRLAEERAEFDRQRAEFEAKQKASEAPPAPQAAPEAVEATDEAASEALPHAVEALDQAREAAPLKLVDINTRINPLLITAAGLAQLGFAALPSQGTTKLYTAADFPRICAALVDVLQQAQVSA